MFFFILKFYCRSAGVEAHGRRLVLLPVGCATILAKSFSTALIASEVAPARSYQRYQVRDNARIASKSRSRMTMFTVVITFTRG